MTVRRFASQVLHGAKVGLASLVMLQMSLAGPFLNTTQAKDHDDNNRARTPIKHVIVIVGENRSFDHIFATYEPAKNGETVDNLLSKHIIKKDGTPGNNFAQAEQYSADVTDSPNFQIAPKKKTLYAPMPAPLNGGPTALCVNGVGMCTLADAMSSEQGLAEEYYPFMLTGGTGLSGKVPDSRITGVHSSAPYFTLKPGPFQLTNSLKTDTFPYDSYAASPVHRYYQMFQQLDCDASYISKMNPDGCLKDLFAWTEVTAGSNSNGVTPPTPTGYDNDYFPGAHTSGEGSTSMGFYNMSQGDAPYTKYLADNFAISDNYHQPAKGGTGLDSIMLFFGDAISFYDPNSSTPFVPPHNQLIWTDNPDLAGTVDEVENPNPVPGTNNYWIEDGYGGGGGFGFPGAVYGGGSYSNCSDPTQPGVQAVLTYLSSLPRPIEPNCDPGHYYLLNNYAPGYLSDGTDAYIDHSTDNTPFTIPPTTQRSIGDVLIENHVSWKGYNDQWNAYLTDKYQLNYGVVGPTSDQYCNICNGFNYQTQIMTNDQIRNNNLKDVTDLYADIANGNLPAVSFVKPSGWVDGHPASSKWNLFEGFVKKIVDAVHSNKELWDSTAIFVTVDEGGGYYDHGYVQLLDFFGDGTRIPLIVVSKWAKKGHISHSYTDHVSVLKFIERNWNLPTISGRSRDNLPNPRMEGGNPYVPANTPAIGDLFDMFDFDHGK